MIRVLVVASFVAALLSATGAAAQQPPPVPVTGSGPVEVLDVGGPLDRLAIAFLEDGIRESTAQLVVLQLSSPGAIDGSITRLIDLVADPPVPVAVWIGPDPAVAYGGVAQLLAAAPIRAAAPGARIGYLAPTVAGREPGGEATRFPGVPPALVTGTAEVGTPIPGLVDLVVPSLGQLVVGVDGTAVSLADRTVVLATAAPSAEGGPAASVPVTFDEGSLFMRVLRIGIQPGAAFFFVVAGIALAVFEFYAAGVGVMAGVAVLCLLLGGYGVVALPVRWWALAAALLGLALYTADFQRNDLGWRSLLGTAGLVAGGLWFVDADPQLRTPWWVVLMVVVGAALFFGVGMTAVVRSRYSTATIGREHLIGREGVAEADFGPDGVVLLDGARWRARGHRAAGIRAGDPVVVAAVEGIVLEVEPSSPPAGGVSAGGGGRQ